MPGVTQRRVVEDSGCERSERRLPMAWCFGRAPARLLEQLGRDDLLSLDVFDTTLMRSCGPPEALYLWLGRRLAAAKAVPCTPEVFARARARVEQQVWHRSGGMDARVGLQDFYVEVCRLLRLDEAVVPDLVAAELALEQEVLMPVPRIADLIAAARERGVRIVFTTDTYFPADFVERQLSRHDLWWPAARLLASSEHGCSKASGRMFDLLRSRVASGPKARLAHAGDNPWSDVTVPRRQGVTTLWMPQARLNRYERGLAADRWATEGMGAALAGASRIARLSAALPDSRAALGDVAAGVAAPFLVGFVLWVLARARQYGLQRLYFIARDGQVFQEVARALLQRLQWPIEVRYLYASRQSTNLAAVFACDEEELAWVFRDRKELLPPALLRQLDIDWEELGAELSEAGVRPNALTTSDDAAERIRHVLQRGAGRQLVLQKAENRRVLVQSYLRQEGLLEGVPSGLVDFGGVGSQMRALHALIRHGGQAPKMFLVGMDSLEDAGLPSTPSTTDWLRDTECYLYDHRRARGIRRPRGFGTCVQMFCAADHGTVQGYRRVGGRIEPVLSERVDAALIQWGLRDFRAVVLEFVDNLVLQPDLVSSQADLRTVCCAAIDLFWRQPSRPEAELWGRFPFEGAQVGSRPRALAMRYSWPRVLWQTLRGEFPDLGWQHWYEGSVQLSPPSLRLALETAQHMYRRVQRSHNPRLRRLDEEVRRLRRWLRQ